MWFLFLLTLANAAAHNENFALRYRIDVAGMPVGIFDALLAIGVACTVVSRGGAWRTERTHPVLVWALVLFALAAVGGSVAALFSKVELRWLATSLRNWVSLPACMVIGYYLLQTPRSNTRFCYLHVIAGILSALMVLLFFRSAAAPESSGDTINKIRAVPYNSSYAGIAAAFLLFTVTSRLRLMPVVLAVGFFGLCLLGQVATLARSAWLAVFSGIAAGYVLIPTFQPRGKLLAALVAPPLVVLFIWIGLTLAAPLAGRDFQRKMSDRVVSMLPGGEGGRESKAWESRLAGIRKELQLWGRSPVFGAGFGAQDVLRFRRGDDAGLGFRHNTFTSTLAQTGAVGLAAVLCMVLGLIVVGRRLARDGVERGYVLMGALAVVTGSYFLVLGMSTQSFNIMRGGIPLAIICGAVMRCRAMQLTHLRMLQEQEAASWAEWDGNGQGAEYDRYPEYDSAPAPAYADSE